MSPLSELGVISTATENVVIDIRKRPNAESRTQFEFDEWTIDEVPLRSLVPDSVGGHPDLRTFMTSESGYWPSAVESLHALLGEDENTDRTGVRFDDGRVGLLFCGACGSLDCYALSASIEAGVDTVTWRDVAYQVAYEPLDLSIQVPFSITFERVHYEAQLRDLLSRWIAKTQDS